MGNGYLYETFEEWCVLHNRQDILDLWDYELNDVAPSEIPKGTKKRYYFKCAEGIHESQTRRILDITNKPDHRLICKECSYHKQNHNYEDLSGQKFGELTVLELDHKSTEKYKMPYWICECSCGNKVSVSAYRIKSGYRTSCKGKGRHIKPKEEIEKIKDLRKSPEYYYYRKAVIEKDKGICVITGQPTKDGEVHHIFPFSIYPNHRFDVDSGVYISKIYHSSNVPGSFHSVYGKINNTPEQFEEYVNEKRKELGIKEHFDVYEYMNDIYSDDLEIDDTMLDLAI